MSNKQRIKTLTSHSKEDFDSQINFHLDIGWKLMKDGLNVSPEKFIQVIFWEDDEDTVTEFHDNGRIKSQEEYENEKLIVRTDYYPNEKISCIEKYSNNELLYKQTWSEDGSMRSFLQKGNDGKLLTRCWYSVVPKYSEFIFSIEGKQESNKYWYEEGGPLYSESEYVDGKEIKNITYYGNGNKWMVTKVLDGRKNIKTYLESGSLNSEDEFESKI